MTLTSLAKKAAAMPFRQRSVSLNDVRTIFGCGFASGSWHPIVETLRELDANSALDYWESTLFAFHTGFCPVNAMQLVGIAGAALSTFEFPWGYFSPAGPRDRKRVVESRFCGPSQDSLIEREFGEIKALLSNIRRVGYTPWAAGHDFIYGTYLIHDRGERRFVVLQGNHRMACLAYLGVRTVAVRTHPRLLKAVRRSESEAWPAVKDGRCSAVAAEKCFDMYFEEHGHHVRRWIGK